MYNNLKVWFNGKICRFEDCKIDLLTHSLHYGDACFEGIHTYQTKNGVAIFRLNEHLKRFFDSMKPLGMKTIFSFDEVFNAVKKIIKINKLGDSYIRPLAFYGSGSLNVYPKDIKPNICIIALSCKSVKIDAINLKTSFLRKINPSSFVFGTKISGFYANSIIAMHDARINGYDEALMLDDSGNVSEGPCQNIFMVKDNKLITSNSKSILPGVTRDSLLELGNYLGFESVEELISLKALKKADESFYCGTLSEIVPIGSIDDIKIGNGIIGKITEKIRDEFYKVVRHENKKYEKWIEFV